MVRKHPSWEFCHCGCKYLPLVAGTTFAVALHTLEETHCPSRRFEYDFPHDDRTRLPV